MKKLILATVLAIAGMNIQTAKAGDHEWATVGKVLTGVAVGAAIVSALDCGHSDYSVSYTYRATACPRPAPVVCAPPMVYAPQPVIVTPPPLVVYHPPVYVAPPRPVGYVSVAYGWGNGHHGGHGHGHRYHRW